MTAKKRRCGHTHSSSAIRSSAPSVACASLAFISKTISAPVVFRIPGDDNALEFVLLIAIIVNAPALARAGPPMLSHAETHYSKPIALHGPDGGDDEGREKEAGDTGDGGAIKQDEGGFEVD